ncbi:hypothetical protein [Mucisphaera sp.]|uniref:hypothetical protein n=1 Tax=Mucisphaera sp. TaxID=2913024 RepID=UPI003D0C396E
MNVPSQQNAALYALGKRQGLFNRESLAILQRYRDFLQSLFACYLAACDIAHGTNPSGDPIASEAYPELSPTLSIDDMQRIHSTWILRSTKGIIEGENGAAKHVGMKAGMLRYRLRNLGIK